MYPMDPHPIHLVASKTPTGVKLEFQTPLGGVEYVTEIASADLSKIEKEVNQAKPDPKADPPKPNPSVSFDYPAPPAPTTPPATSSKAPVSPEEGEHAPSEAASPAKKK